MYECRSIELKYKRRSTNNSMAVDSRAVRAMTTVDFVVNGFAECRDLFIRATNSRGVYSPMYFRISEPTPELLTEMIEALADLRRVLEKQDAEKDKTGN